MKDRWIGGLLLVTALALGACAPTDAGADDASATPSARASQEASESSTPTPAEDDEY